jgi:hypothetical protein
MDHARRDLNVFAGSDFLELGRIPYVTPTDEECPR